MLVMFVNPTMYIGEKHVSRIPYTRRYMEGLKGIYG